MGFRTGAYAKVWEIKAGDRTVDLQISINKKNKETGQYDKEFSGFVRCIGPAAEKARSLKSGDRIKLGDVDVSQRYDKEKERTYVNFKMFSFDIDNGGGAQRSAPLNQSSPVNDGLPF